MSWVRERLGLEKPKSQPKQQKDEYGIRARLGLVETPKNTAPKFASRSEKTDNISSQYKFAAEKLAESRKNYQDYIKEETKDTRALKVSPLSSPMSTDLTAKNPEMLEVAQQRAQDLEKAVKSDKAKELKQDVKEKQGEFNYANYLKNVEDVNNMKVTAPQKVYNPIISGIADFFQTDRLNPEGTYHYDEEGNKSYLPTKRKLKQQKIREESGKIGKVYNDIAYNMSKAVTSKVVDMVAPGAGTTLYYGDILTDSIEEARNQGYSGGEAVAYGISVATVAATLDKFLGTFGGLSNTSNTIPTLSQGLDKMFFKITSKKTASTILSNMTSEALSEYYEEFADNALKYVINSDQSGYDSFIDMLSKTMPDAIYSGLIGGLSGGVGGVMENITNGQEMAERRQALEDYKTTLENYKPQTVEEAQYKEDQIVQVEQMEQAIDEKEQETIEKAKDLSKLSDKELKDLQLAQEIFGLETKETEQEIKNRTDFLDETEEELLNQPNKKEQEVEEAKKMLKLEDDAVVKKEQKVETRKVASKEEPPKAKVSKPLNFREALTDYKVEDILQQINTYNQEQIQKNLITTERVRESYNNNKLDLAYATLVMKSNKASNFSQTRAENYFKLLSKKLSDTDKSYVYRNLDKTNSKLAEMAEKYFAPTKQEVIKTDEQKVKAKELNVATNKKQISVPKKQPIQSTMTQDEFIESSKKMLGLQADKKKLDIKNGEKIIQNLTSDKKQQETLTKVFSEPQKNKTTVNVGKDTKVITPSETIRNGDYEQVREAINNTVSEDETVKIQREEKARRKSFENMLKKYKAEGNEERAKFVEYQLENNLYEVKHTAYEVYNEELNMLEDPEHYYANFRENFDKAMQKGDLTEKQIDKFQNQIMAMERYYGAYDTPSYNPTIANELSVLFGEMGTETAQTLAARKNFYNSNPKFLVRKVTQVLRSIYNEQLKKHEGDIAWKEANDPTNPNSPYHLNDTQYATIDKIGNDLSKIEDKMSLEYLQKEAALNNYIQDIYNKTEFGSKLASITNKIRSITVSNVLASTRIWTQNIKGNFVNMAQFKILDNLPAVLADKVISSKTGMRTRGISFQGDVVVGSRAFKRGVYDTWYELKYDVTLSKFASKYVTKKEGALGDRGYGKTFDDSTKVGHALNRYQDFVNFALTMGDRPFANMYYEQSIYNQRMTNAMLHAQKKGTNMVYKENYNSETKTHAVSYYDANGDIHSGEFMTEAEYNRFMEDAEVQDITVDMCAIAEKEALENTYQNDNTITRAAVKMKNALNDVFHIGEYGFGDMLLKFTRTGSNMAKALYEHSPLEAITLTKDLMVLNKNLKNINEKTGENTVTPELQHKVASEFGKLIGGTMTMFVIGALNWSGITNIEDEEDKDKIKNFKSSTTGSRTYSVKLPGLNYNYKISPDSTIGSLMRVGVDIEQMYERTGSVIDAFLKSATPFMNEIIDNTFMESVLGLGSSYSTPIDNIARKIAAQPANLIPSAAKDLSYAFDGFTDRTTYDDNLGKYMINQIINRTPFRGNEKIGLSSKKTAWGEEKKIGGDILASAWNTFLLGENLAKVNDDEVAQEIINVYTSIGKTDAMPNLNKPNKTIRYNNDDVELTEQERDRYQVTYGQTAYKAVSDLMQTSQYQDNSDEYKYKLLKQAYDYAREKATQEVVEDKGGTYYNATKKDNRYTEYKKPVFEEIVENDISIKEAQYKRQYEDAYKLKTVITNWENYTAIEEDIKAIKDKYSNDNGYNYKTRSYAVQTYISKLKGLTPTQKAMISKLENNKGDYSSYDNAILNYLKKAHLTQEEFEYMYDKLGLGGYWKQYYYTKK